MAVIDRAAFGQNAEEMQSKIFKKYNNVFLIPGYECFEELLLHTNFFSDDEFVTEVLVQPSEFANSKLSWESYFEELINIATKKKPYRHTHSTDQLFKCYWMSCDHEQSCDQYIKNKCFKRSKGDKFIWMLSGTKYEILLGFCDKNPNLDKHELQTKYIKPLQSSVFLNL